MEGEAIIIIQLIGFATSGGLIGEAYRTINSGYTLDRYFIVNSIAGGFLAFLLAWGYYNMTGNRGIASVLAGIISYQDEKKINKLARKFISDWAKGGSGDERD